jgi:sugar transferase (PEP-CTERM/EpsH1 system associated)
MKILFLAQRVPYPPNKGDKLRSFNQIRYLSGNHEISLVCLADSERDLEHARELRSWCRSVDAVHLPRFVSKVRSAVSLFSSRPLTLGYFYSRTLRSLIDKKLRNEEFDLIFVFCSSMAQYVEDVYAISRVIDFVDVDSEKWLQYSCYSRFPYAWLYALESRRLRRYEKQLAKSYQHCFLVSEKEVDDFRRLVSPCPTLTPILNGVDGDLFQPSDERYDPNTLVFTGAMDYFANVEAVIYFAREILPHISNVIPDVKFYVVGSNPTEELNALAKASPNIVVTGYVDQVQPYMAQAAVFVAPMRIARGVQNKILEAMAMGVPVVTSSLGHEGISAVPGTDIFVEDEAESFANRVIDLMRDDGLRLTTSVNARRVVEQSYCWSANLATLESVLSKVVSCRF